MPRGRYQQQQWETREHAILDTLALLSAERGFDAITMDELADAVGISKATLYQHFASKDDLLVRLIYHHAQEFRAWLDLNAGEPPMVRLRNVMRYLMEGQISVLRGLIHVGHEDKTPPIFETNMDLANEHARVLEDLSAIIREGQAAGAITVDLSPRVVINAMWAFSNIAQSQYGPEGDTLTAEDYMAQLIILFERGITPPSTG
jgi:AcrR family transcriptional regulator